MGGDTGWQASYADPLRARPDGSAADWSCKAPPQTEEIENELCVVNMVMMHKPTHDPARAKTGEYPFSWHLQDRRRLWEFRMQIRFKRLPESRLYLGIELDKYVPLGGMAKQAQKTLVSACQSIVGDCYHTAGDDPAKVQGELEVPAFVMPLWAFDQFHVAERGQEPSLLSDLEGVGMLRADSLSKYIAALKQTTSTFSTDKVYTFCLWGISKYLDIMRWEVTGTFKLDFNTLCGAPPVYMTIYELPGVGEQDKDKRHLASRKKQYFRAAMWSELKPPRDFRAAVAASASDEEIPSLENWLGDGGGGGSPGGGSTDLLSLDDFLGDAKAAPAAAAAPAPAPKAENADLLGLDLLA